MATATGTPPAIQTIDLSKRYARSVLAVDAISLEVRPGEIFGFLGPNGAGKTTTIRILLDLIRPTAGRARVFGLDCQRDSVEVRKRVGYLPGDLSLYRDLAPRQFFRLFAGLRPGGINWPYANSLCERLEVPMDRPSGSLSKGNRQKIGVALALMHRPDLLILDEPTAGLDPLVQHQMLDLLREARDEGRTVFFSSHVLPEVERICDRVGIIRKGRIVAVEEVAALKERRTHRMQVTFGDPPPAGALDGLPGVHVLEHGPRSVLLEVTGEVDRLVKALARCHVDTLETTQPSLEEVFMRYYATEPEEPAVATEARHG